MHINLFLTCSGVSSTGCLPEAANFMPVPLPPAHLHAVGGDPGAPEEDGSPAGHLTFTPALLRWNECV